MFPEATIREFHDDDLVTLVGLNRDAVPEVGEADEQRLAWIIDQSVTTLVVEDGGLVVAFVIVLGPGADYDSTNYRFFADRYGSFAYIDRVVVAPSHQRGGLGARMYDEVEKRVSGEAAVLTAEVNVTPPNPNSLAFHAARGFESVGEQDSHDGKRVRMFLKDLG